MRSGSSPKAPQGGHSPTCSEWISTRSIRQSPAASSSNGSSCTRAPVWRESVGSGLSLWRTDGRTHHHTQDGPALTARQRRSDALRAGLTRGWRTRRSVARGVRACAHRDGRSGATRVGRGVPRGWRGAQCNEPRTPQERGGARGAGREGLMEPLLVTLHCGFEDITEVDLLSARSVLEAVAKHRAETGCSYEIRARVAGPLQTGFPIGHVLGVKVYCALDRAGEVEQRIAEAYGLGGTGGN